MQKEGKSDYRLVGSRCIEGMEGKIWKAREAGGQESSNDDDDDNADDGRGGKKKGMMRRGEKVGMELARMAKKKKE